MSNSDQIEVKTFSVKETAAELRTALRAAFPGVKFSVRMSRGTGHGWLSVSWTDGPTEPEVRAINNGFRSSYFDGQDDGYHRIEPTLYAREDGTLYEPRYSCRGINTSRHYSDQAEAWAARVAVPGSEWWREDVAPQMYDPAYYGTRALLSGTDLMAGIPSASDQAGE